MDLIGWVANCLLIVCAACVHKHRWALLFGATGGFLWAFKAYSIGWWDLLFIEIILSVLQLRGYLKWDR